MSPFRLVTLEPASTIYAGGIATAAKRILRTPGLADRLEQARSDAVGELPMPPELREAYAGQIERSHRFVEAHDFGMLQTYAGHTIPLISQDWVKSVPVPVPAHDIVPDLLAAMNIDPRGALDNLHAAPGAYVEVLRGKVSIYAPNEPSLAALICTVHELGHYLYEIAGGQPDPNSFIHYLESEAAALSFCYTGILTFLRMRDASPRDFESWEEYVRADLVLNHYFFLEEAQCLGMFAGALPPVGMKFLRDNRTKLLGYQIVYAAASTLAEEHAWPLAASLRNAIRHPSRMMRIVARTVGAQHLYPENRSRPARAPAAESAAKPAEGGAGA